MEIQNVRSHEFEQLYNLGQLEITSTLQSVDKIIDRIKVGENRIEIYETLNYNEPIITYYEGIKCMYILVKYSLEKGASICVFTSILKSR